MHLCLSHGYLLTHLNYLSNSLNALFSSLSPAERVSNTTAASQSKLSVLRADLCHTAQDLGHQTEMRRFVQTLAMAYFIFFISTLRINLYFEGRIHKY